jgi:hypothetical protein
MVNLGQLTYCKRRSAALSISVIVDKPLHRIVVNAGFLNDGREVLAIKLRGFTARESVQVLRPHSLELNVCFRHTGTDHCGNKNVVHGLVPLGGKGKGGGSTGAKVTRLFQQMDLIVQLDSHFWRYLQPSQ